MEKSEISKRADGLTEGRQFFVTLLFNQEGFYTSVVGLCRDTVMAKAYTRSHVIKSLVACSLIFEGKWVLVNNMLVPSISLPEDFREELVSLDKNRND